MAPMMKKREEQSRRSMMIDSKARLYRRPNANEEKHNTMRVFSKHVIKSMMDGARVQRV